MAINPRAKSRRTAVAVMRRAAKMRQKEVSRICPVCGVTYLANPVQYERWGEKCHTCFCA